MVFLPTHIGPAEHASFEEYMECKSLLFRQCRIGIVNADDEHVDGILKGHTCEVKTFSAEREADLMASDIGFINEDGKLGMHFNVTGCMDCQAKVHIPGRFSVYNSMVTMLVCHLAGISDEAILEGLSKVQVKGRVEMLPVSKDYTLIIEKKAENLYRTISQKIKNLPTSNQAVKQSVLRTQQLNLTPQESEQLSKYVSDDTYVKQQKEDIEELASMFKDMLGKPDDDMDTPFVKELESHFVSTEDFAASYSFIIEGIKKPLYVAIENGELEIHYGQEEKIDVVAKLSRDVLQSIIDGRMTFQRAFMTGEMTAKGNFKTLRMLDQIFVF